MHQFDDGLADNEAILSVERLQSGLWFGRKSGLNTLGMSVFVELFMFVFCKQNIGCYTGFLVHDVDQGQIVTLAHFEVVEIVRGRYLDGAGALLGIGIFVGDDRNAPADQRQDRVPVDQIPVALVVRMHGDRGVAQHGLGPRGRDGDEGVVEPLQRIFEIPQLALDLDLLHLDVGERGQELGVPMDQPLVLVDQAGLVELHEHFEHGARQRFVHGEALPRPIARRAQSPELPGDGAAGFLLPFPHALDEGLATHGAPARLLALHQLALDHHLGRDPGMIGAGLPEHVASAHALEPHQHVL